MALASLLLLGGCQQQQTGNDQGTDEIVRPAKIVAVVSSGIDYTRSYPGTLEASDKANLAFRVSGQVSQLPAKAGQRVKKGELLARLDDTDFRNTLAERRARYQLAKVQHEQSRKLLKQKLTSKLKFDQAEAELKSAQAALDQADANLGYTHLYAPFEGVVAQVDVQNFQSVQAMAPVMKLQNDRSLDIRFSVPESVISQLKRIEDPEVISQVCGRVQFAAHPDRRFKACYKESESVADPVTRNYSALFTLEDTSELALLPGMTASIEIDFAPYLAQADQQRLYVPLEAIFSTEGKQWVWTVDTKNQAHKKQVFGGRFEGDLIEITLGLEPQDRVIAAGVSYVREGMTVKPINKERGL
jgi:RND family efflux transporter MFP subunit